MLPSALHGFSDFEQDPEDMADLPDSRGWTGRYWAVRDEGNGLVGFFCFETQGDAIEIGLGLRPDRTRKGLGESYVKAGLEFARTRFRPERFLIQAAKFNRRAIHVYEKLGFQIDKVFLQKTNGGEIRICIHEVGCKLIYKERSTTKTRGHKDRTLSSLISSCLRVFGV